MHMKIKFVIHLILASSAMKINNMGRKREYQSTLAGVTSKIITSVFPKCYCLYYYTNNCEASSDVEATLKNLNVPLVLLPRYNLAQYKDNSSCDGYVLVSDNYEELKDTFTQNKTDAFYYKTHKKILIFYNYFNDFNTEFYLNLTHLDGLEIITVQGYDIEKTKRITVNLLRKNKTLFEWNINTTIENFIFEKWFPNFVVLNKTYNFKASVFECPPFIYYNRQLKKVVDGIEYRILESIQPKLPLEFIAHLAVDGTSQWSLNLKDVMKGFSNIAMCSQWQISVVTRDMDMTLPYTQSCSTFLVPKPHLLPQSTYVFQPFQIQLWLFCYFLSQLFGLLLHVATKTYKNILNLGVENAYCKIGIALMHGIRIFTLGSTYMPHPILGALRQIVLMSSLAALLLSTAYSSGFTSSLTSPRFEKPINFIIDMVEQLTYWGAKEMDTFAVYNTTKNPDLQLINKRFVLETSDNDRQDRIIKDNYAFPINSLPNHYITETEALSEYAKTHLKILNECVGLYYLVFGLKRNSPYTDLINKHIGRCNEHGLMNHWYGDIQSFGGWSYMDNFFATYVSTENSFKALSIKKIQGIFICLVLGLTSSIVVFFLELFYYNNKVIIAKFCKKIAGERIN